MKNPTIAVIEKKVLSDGHYKMYRYKFSYTDEGIDQVQTREVFDRGDGVAVLLYNAMKQSVILTRQFRLPTMLNENPSGMMLEVCAGTLAQHEDPTDCARREVTEETGYTIDRLDAVGTFYMSPGAVTEKLHLYIAQVDDSQRTGTGGGLASEHENIEVVEIPFYALKKMFDQGDILDAKTAILIQALTLRRLDTEHD